MFYTGRLLHNNLTSRGFLQRTSTLIETRKSFTTIASAMASRSVLWFRKGLRLHDNPALHEAIDGGSADALFPVFILDPNFQDVNKVGVNRMQFLFESLADLDASLRARGSRLFVLRGNPTQVLPQVFREWNINRLCFEKDSEPYAKTRDAAVRQLAATAGVAVHDPVSHTLYDLDQIVAKNGGKAPLTMKSFEKIVDSMGDPQAPAADPPETLPAYPKTAVFCQDGESLVPTLAEIKYPTDGSTTMFRGGESVALARMAQYLADENWIASFEKPKGNPAQFTPLPATTVLSPYLKFGCLSPRLFHVKLLEVYKRKKNHTKPPVSLRGQLLWKEFFYTCGAFIPNFDRMEGSSICKQVPWVNNEAFLQAWEHGKTGFPWIDAIMNQLRLEGWMHHLARHSVACFLTRGDLWCSWEKGRDIFDKYLLDADWSINNGNWLWLSASAFFNQYFRVYSPISFGKQYDKNGDYIRRYVPALKDMPAKYIYEPWTAPKAVQEQAKCIIGVDYPMPIVDHAVVLKENLAKMKSAYAAGKQVDGGGEEGEEGEQPVAKKAKK